MSNSYFWFVPAIGVAIGILVLSTFLTFPLRIEGIGYSDKLQHSFVYMLLTNSFLVAFFKINLLDFRVGAVIFFITGCYGFLMELLQFYFFEHRHFEWYDVLANTLGIVIGFISFWIWRKVSGGH